MQPHLARALALQIQDRHIHMSYNLLVRKRVTLPNCNLSEGVYVAIGRGAQLEENATGIES